MSTDKHPLKVLFVSKHAAHGGMAMAGNQMFYDTLLSFCRDERFECGFMTVQKNGPDLQQMKAVFSPFARDFTTVLPRIWTLFTHLFYTTRLGIVLSYSRSSWFMLDPVYRYFYRKALRRVRGAGWQPDVIVLEWTEVLFLEDFCRKIFPQAHLVVTEHDVSYVKLERRFAGHPKVLKRLVAPFKQAELEALHHMDLVRVLSKDDRARLVQAHIPIQDISVTAPFFQDKNLPAQRPIKKQVVFYGAMNRMENQEAVQWFIEQVYIPFRLSEEVRFVVMGGGKNSLKERYGAVPGIDFTGFVAAPSRIFVESLCMVVPLLNGGGIKIKVLEAMSCSLPVLTNEIGMEGIGGKEGEVYLLCTTPQQYADHIRLLLSEEAFRYETGEQARRWIGEHFNYTKDLSIYKEQLLAMRHG